MIDMPLSKIYKGTLGRKNMSQRDSSEALVSSSSSGSPRSHPTMPETWLFRDIQHTRNPLPTLLDLAASGLGPNVALKLQHLDALGAFFGIFWHFVIFSLFSSFSLLQH